MIYFQELHLNRLDASGIVYFLDEMLCASIFVLYATSKYVTKTNILQYFTLKKCKKMV